MGNLADDDKLHSAVPEGFLSANDVNRVFGTRMKRRKTERVEIGNDEPLIRPSVSRFICQITKLPALPPCLCVSKIFFASQPHAISQGPTI
jgi:hypothetical protein